MERTPITAVSVLRMRKSAILWLSMYLGLVVLAVLQQAPTTAWLEQYGQTGLLSRVVGVLVFALVPVYLMRLQEGGRLR